MASLLPGAGQSLSLRKKDDGYTVMLGDAQIERHYVSMRSRAQPSVLAFLAQDAAGRAFCYSNADLRKGEEAEEIFRFIEFWKKHHGALPRHLVFDSRLTTCGAQVQQILNRLQNVFRTETHFRFSDIQTELAVDAETADTPQSVAIRVIELFIEQSLGFFQCGRITWTEPLVDSQQSFLMAR